MYREGWAPGAHGRRLLEYRGTSLIRHRLLLGPYSMVVLGGGLFLMSEVPLYDTAVATSVGHE